MDAALKAVLADLDPSVASTLEENGINTVTDAKLLTAADCKEMGLSIGQRNKLLFTVAQAKDGPSLMEKIGGSLKDLLTIGGTVGAKQGQFSKGDSFKMDSEVMAVGLCWDVLRDGRAIDLDTSCVTLGFDGQLLMDECVYFAMLRSKSGAIVHTGDEREGDEDLGQGDDEIIIVNTTYLPENACALYFISTVATSGRTFADVKTSKMRFWDQRTGVEMCKYEPAMGGGAHTALLGVRLARRTPHEPWVLTALGEVDATARDWGTLVPELKFYSQDLVRGIKVDANERIAVMRKGGGAIRISDYCPNGVPDTLCLGCHWDITQGKNIDLDASAILLGADLSVLDLVWFKHLRSNDGSIQHGGDEQEGDEKGDDEKIFLSLAKVNPAVAFIGLVINSYSGQELDDVKNAGCHLFDPRTAKDVVKFKMSNSKALDKKRALLVGMLFRDAAAQEWCFEIIEEGAQGRTVNDNVDELQNFIRSRQASVPPPPRPPVSAGPPPPGVLGTAVNVAITMPANFIRTVSGRIFQQGPAA